MNQPAREQNRQNNWLMPWPAVLAVGAGGLAGAGVRWLAMEVLPSNGGWPWGVFAANLAGCVVLGFVTAAAPAERLLVRLAAAAGFCGSLTTFSALTVDTVELVRDNRFGLGVAYLLVTLAAGLGAVLVGLALRSAR